MLYLFQETTKKNLNFWYYVASLAFASLSLMPLDDASLGQRHDTQFLKAIITFCKKLTF
jgi:hypothetical protein